MDNREIARLLGEVADLLEIQAEANPFRIRSYRLAAEAIQAHGADVAGLAREGGDLRGTLEVGEGMAAKIREIVQTGDSADRRKLLQEVPEGLLELLRISGLGPKGVSRIWKGLAVRSAAELEQAIRDGRLRTLPGMGEKKEALILRGLERLRHPPHNA